jgi:aspartate aminotransferase
VKNNIIVISDEIYEHLIYNPKKKHISIASLGKEIYDRTILVNGVSKSYSMTGWRIGYAACPLEVAKCINSLQSHTASNPNSIAQMAALEALTGPQDSVEYMRQRFQKRCDYIFEREESIPLISALKPDGAFYLFVSIEKTVGKKYNGEQIKDAASFATILLENKLTAVVPCADFGMPNYIRLSYAISLDDIKKGMDRIEEFIKALN